MTEDNRSAQDDRRAPVAMDDLELITSAVNGHLSLERVEEVRRRLETDEAFRELAAPVLLTWSVPPHLERHPRPVGELERDWDAFARRNGIGKYRRGPGGPGQPGGPGLPPGPEGASGPERRGGKKKQPRWLRALYFPLAAFVILLPQQEFRGAIALALKGELRSYPIPYDTGWLAIGDRISVQMHEGTKIRQFRRAVRGMTHVQLDGAANFRISPFRDDSPELRGEALFITTSAGEITAGESEFSVDSHGDTTDVLVLPTLRWLQRRRPDARVTVSVEAEPSRESPLGTHAIYSVTLSELEKTTIVRGQVPRVFRNTP